MRRLLFWIVLLPLAILTVLFAVANRAPVIISFDPFSTQNQAAAITLPLFIVIFAAMIMGVVLGGLVSVVRHYRLWRAARTAREEAERHKADAEAERRTREAMQPNYPSLSAPP
jgi:uncharacterized integral membrane protein